MIERQIKQLHAVGITDITIVVGYLKEKFEYLIDKYDVKLLYNPEYSCKNTLATVYHAKKVLQNRNVYLLSSDNWMRDNMFHTYECFGWYSSVFMNGLTSEWCLSFNKKGHITGTSIGGHDSWVMYGPAFFSKTFSKQFLFFGILLQNRRNRAILLGTGVCRHPFRRCKTTNCKCRASSS